MSSMGSLKEILADTATTSFIVVSIPTHLAVAESKRLLSALRQAEMPARHLIINQCSFLPAADGTDEASLSFAAAEKMSEQPDALGISVDEAAALRRTMKRILRKHQDALRQATLLESDAGPELQIFRMPVFDQELTGVAAL